MRKKIILIRLDKIGDLACTLPVDQVLDPNEYDVTWIIQSGLGELVQLGLQPRKFFELDKKNPDAARVALKKILSELKPDIAISFQSPWWVNFELFKARVPLRGGVKSQWHSFLFLNRGLRQKRSLAVKHELAYNLDLVNETLGLSANDEKLYFEMKKPSSQKTLQKFNLSPQDYVVVHPGMMGSALNWKQSQYIEYIERILKTSKKVVLTGTRSDEPYMTKIKLHFSHHPELINLQSHLNFSELVEVLFNAAFVVAPSTGVAHLAAGVGSRVRAIYSPIRVHHPRRWAPRGPAVEVFLPPVVCPATHQCLKEKCVHYNCMDLVTLE